MNLSLVPRPVRVRFAPSPTGTLHIGSARTALYNYLYARHQEGSFILRIEDTDAARSTSAFEQSILKDLAWLGLDWDEGPDRGGDCGPYRQSERVQAGIYSQAAGRLLDERKAYRCFCSQERLEQLKQECLDRGEMPKYDRRCAGLSPDEAQAKLAAGEPATIRFRVPETEIVVNDLIHGHTKFSSDVLGDFIIIRSDGGVAYNFAVVVDDIQMAISHVIRGEDHLTNTARQLLVFRALGQEPPVYAHHSLILGPDGGKLSKRHGATSVGEFRQAGYLPEAIINYLALLSWKPSGDQENLSRSEMVRDFEIYRVSRSPAIFDIQKLNWLNGLHIRDLDREAFHAAIGPFRNQAAAAATEAQMAVAEKAIQTSLVTLAETEARLKEFFDDYNIEAAEDFAELLEPQSLRVLELAVAELAGLSTDQGFAVTEVEPQIAAARELVARLKLKCREGQIPAKRMYRTLRIALTGRSSGPELPFLLAGLARDTVRLRLTRAHSYIAARLAEKTEPGG